VQALVRSARGVKYQAKILEAVEEVNRAQKSFLVTKIRRHFKDQLKGMKIALWGLAFKPNTDDMREAPALTIIDELLGAGATVSAFDPVAMTEAKRIVGSRSGISFSEDPYAALAGADVLAIATEWQEFRSPDFDRIKGSLKHAAIFDGRNLYSPELMARLGICYYGVGRGLS
jgi:UDPglucose 6-dehydrogenase